MARNWLSSRKKQTLFGIGGLVLLVLLLAACSGSGTSTSTTTAPNQKMYSGAKGNNAATGATTSAQGGSQQSTSPQYLIKTLKVGMQVSDTRKVADDLQTWISNTDPLAISAGTDYQQVGNNQYNATMTFAIQASKYLPIYRYIRDYTTQKGGTLTSFTETVQDVTGDYVDTQSRIKNLRTEQTRLQDLMSHAQALNDVITIDQRLTDVEGQIETTEAHLNSLSNQVAFYTITITLQPTDTTSTATPSNSGWSLGQTLHDAFSASIIFGQGLLSFLVWLLAFALYFIPIILIVWFVRRWRKRPPVATPHPAEEPAILSTSDV